MKTAVADLSSIKKRLTVELPAEEVVKAKSKALDKYRAQAKIKGFRTGKIPDAILERYYGQEIAHETMTELIRSSYPQAVRETGLDPLSMPQIEDVVYTVGAPFSYAAAIEVRPAIALKNYRGLTVTKPVIHISDAEMDTQLLEIQRRFTELHPAPEGSLVHSGVVVTVDYIGSIDGKPFEGGEVKGYVFEVGSGAVLVEFEDALIGVKKAGTKKFSLTYPDSYFNKELAGKSASFDAKVVEIKVKKIPPIDDELARQVGSYESLEALRGRVKEELFKGKDREAEHVVVTRIMDELIRTHPVELPEGLVHEELEAMVREAGERLKSQGLTWEQAGTTEADFKEQSISEARRRISAYLILREIAEKEGMTVSEGEIDGHMQQIADRMRQPIAKVKEYYRSHGLQNTLASEILERKVLNLLRETAHVKEEVQTGFPA